VGRSASRQRNVPAATGASRPVVLGAIVMGNHRPGATKAASTSSAGAAAPKT